MYFLNLLFILDVTTCGVYDPPNNVWVRGQGMCNWCRIRCWNYSNCCSIKLFLSQTMLFHIRLFFFLLHNYNLVSNWYREEVVWFKLKTSSTCVCELINLDWFTGCIKSSPIDGLSWRDNSESNPLLHYQSLCYPSPLVLC